jgi:hypothetical protein
LCQKVNYFLTHPQFYPPRVPTSEPPTHLSTPRTSHDPPWPSTYNLCRGPAHPMPPTPRSTSHSRIPSTAALQDLVAGCPNSDATTVLPPRSSSDRRRRHTGDRLLPLLLVSGRRHTLPSPRWHERRGRDIHGRSCQC